MFFLIIIISAFFRFYKLSSFPVQLNHDEVGQLYDGMSILKTGKDVYGNKLPFIFVSIGDFKPPFYTYASLPFVYLFNGSEVSIRILGALFGVLLVYAIYFLSESLFSKSAISLIASFLTAISPFAVHFSRKSFEGIVGLTLVILALGFLFRSAASKAKKNRFFILGSVFLALSMYTYFSYFFVVPVLLLAFILFKYKSDHVFLWPSLLVFLVLVLPLFIMVSIDKNSKNRVRAVSILQDQVLNDLLQRNVGSNGDSFKKFIYIGKYSLARYFNQFNPTFLFVNGLDVTNQDPVDIGFFYFYEFVFIFLGLFFGKFYLKRKEFYSILLFILFLSMIPSALSFENHSPHRVLLSLQFLLLFSAVGGYVVLSFLFSLVKKTIWRFALFLFTVLIIIWHTAYFLVLYTIVSPIDKSEFIQYPYKLVGQMAGKYYDEYDSIVFDPRFGEYYPWVGGAASYYLAYYSGFPVEKMQSEYKISKEDGESVISFGKYKIKDVSWERDRNMTNALFIVSPWVANNDILGKLNLVGVIYSLKQKPAFYLLSNKEL